MTSSTLLATVTLLLIPALTGAAAEAEMFAIFKSTDDARSWVRADAGLPADSRINAFGSAAGVLVAGTDSGVFVSRDEARSWQPGAGAAMSSDRILSFATLGRKVFAGTDGKGLLVSTDGGRSWTSEPAFPSRKVRCLRVHDGKVHAGTDADGVFVSEGGGQPWTRLTEGLPVHAQVFAMASVGGRLFAGLYGRGLYAWDEEKEVWAKKGPVTPLALAGAGDTLVAGHNPGGLHWSGDAGATWSKGIAAGHAGTPLLPLSSHDSGELSPEAPVWELGSNDEDLVVAGAAEGIYFSNDRGRTWGRARHGLPTTSPGIAFLVKGDLVLAASRIGMGVEKPQINGTGK